MTWSERQAQAKKQREEEDAQSLAATTNSTTKSAVAIGGTAALGLAAGATLGVGAGIAGVAAAGLGALAVNRAIESEKEEQEEEQASGGAPPPPPPPSPPPPPPYTPSAPLAKVEDAKEEIVQKVEELHPPAAEETNDELPPRTANSGQRGKPSLSYITLLAEKEVTHYPFLFSTLSVPARVLFEYTKDEENEMDLIEGEILEGIEMIDEGWWSARGTDQQSGQEKSGLFPCTCLYRLFLLNGTRANALNARSQLCRVDRGRTRRACERRREARRTCRF